jgi:hypothetical protein
LPHVEGDPIHDLRLALGVSYEGQGLVLSVNCVFMQGPRGCVLHWQGDFIKLNMCWILIHGVSLGWFFIPLIELMKLL